MRYKLERQGDKWIVRVWWDGIYTLNGLKEIEIETITYRGDEKGANEEIQLLKEIYGEG